MNNNYNNISFDYVGATGTHTITDYIDITSNILNNKIDITSNILKLYTDININNLDNKYNELINQKTEIETYSGINYNVKHTYINNSNLDNPFSEIRFYSKNAINYPTYEITASPIYKVKIGNDGKLYLWYSYNPFISLTLPSQWVDINQEIGKQQADGLNQGSAIVTIENQIILINSTLTAISGEITSLYGLASGSSGSGGLSASPYNVPRLDNGIITTAEIESIRNNLIIRAQTVQNYITNLGGATGILAVIYGIAEGFSRIRYTNTMIDELRSNLNTNIGIGNTQNAEIISNTMIYTSNIYLSSNLKDVYDNYSNLGIIQGFINTNIQTQQIIPNISTNSITFNGTPLTTILNNYVLKSGSTMTGTLTTNSIIYNGTELSNTTSLNNYLKLSGGTMTGQITGITTLSASTGLFGTIATTNTNVGIPSIGIQGGIGDKLILYPGTASLYPYSLGINTNTLWYSTPTSASHKFYSGGTNTLTLDNLGNLTAIGIIDSPNIKQGGTNIITLSQSNILNNTPNVAKKYGFYISITTPISVNGITFYKYDINLNTYTAKGIIDIGSGSGDPYRIFKLKVMLAPLYFSTITNGLLDVCYYDIFLSYKANAAPGGVAGLNAAAIGFPENINLTNILPNNIFVIKNGLNSIDYITIIARSICDCRIIIEDLLS